MQHKNIEMPIGFDELWRAAGVSKSLAQNWTNGRPLRLVPSLSQGEGKGSRHIYAVADAYLLAFLHLLKRHGLSDDSLRKVANVFNIWGKGKPSNAIHFFSEKNHWLEVSLTELTVMIGPIPYDPAANTLLSAHPLQLNDVHDLIGMQVAVNLTKLRAQVDQRLQDQLNKSNHAGRN
jgi:hypothetical protein